MKRVLITGESSYIGKMFTKWMSQWPDKYNIHAISVRGNKWKNIDFSNYDTVLHLAGIAHVSANPKFKELYYKVNRDLTIEVAKKAKSEGVNQFIFMSSIIVYGGIPDTEKIIKSTTVPIPNNFYGESKLQAEEGLKLLESNQFKIAVIRPPMIYGKGSLGNYTRLSKLARLTPIFPNFENRRSMLHIDNLSELIKLLIESEKEGLYFPQNKEYVSTSNMVTTIAKIHNKKIWMTRIFNFFIMSLLRLSLVRKLFGDLIYDKKISRYKDLNYQIRLFEESIELTEMENKK